MEQKKKSILPIKRKFSITEKIIDFFETRKEIKFWSNMQSDNPEYREKAIKIWNKMRDDRKIKFIIAYTKLVSSVREGDAKTLIGNPFYSEQFETKLMDELWKNSSYTVQRQSLDLRVPVIPRRPYLVYGNSRVAYRNWKYTDLRLQKEILEQLINCESTDMTLRWRSGILALSKWNENYYIYEYKSRRILELINDTNPDVLLEMCDGIMQFLNGEFVTDEILEEFAQKLPENVKKQKVDTTFDYSVRDYRLFAEKWEGLSYEEKIAKLKGIFSTSISEYTSGTKDTNIIRRMYPYYYKVEDKEKNIIGTSFISYDYKVIQRIISDIRGDDLDKYLCNIIEQKKDNPFTIYHIWSSLDRRAQIKYYDQVMQLLEEYPKSQYGLWCATQTNSENQRKKQEAALSQIQTIEDIQSLKGNMRFLIKGVSENKQSTKKINKDVQRKPTIEERD